MVDNFEDEHDSLERELLTFFEAKLGERVFGPARDEALKLLSDYVEQANQTNAQIRQEITGSLDGLNNVLAHIEQARTEAADASGQRLADLAAEARRRIEEVSAGARQQIEEVGRAKVETAQAPWAMDQRLGHLQQQVDYLVSVIPTLKAKGGSGAPPDVPPPPPPPPPPPRPGLVSRWMGSRKVTLFLTVTQLATALLLGFAAWQLFNPPKPPSNLELRGGSSAPAKPASSWAAIRRPEFCPAEKPACSFDEAWAVQDQSNRREIATAAITWAAGQGQNCPEFALDENGVWVRKTSESLDGIAKCLGVSPFRKGDNWPKDEDLLDVAKWALDRKPRS